LKAIILAGGLGKRLKPITDYIPKSLVPLNNIPIIEWQIKYLKKYGVNEIIICSGYKSKMIENFLLAKNNLNTHILFAPEKTPLGTGGAIRQAISSIKDKSVLVLNGDVITDIDLNKIIQNPNSIAAIELKSKFGIMKLADNKIIKFEEKKEISDVWMNAGIYNLKTDIIMDLPKKGDIEKSLFPDYAKKGKLYVVKFKNAIWYSIDSFKDIEECSLDLKSLF
jgi:NDP-sugar pyrophosphorylase family protein